MNTIRAADIPTLKRKGLADFYYLASPYSRYPHGTAQAYRDASKIAAEFIRADVPVFCPIAHSHPIAKHGDIDPLAHSVWLAADEPLMRNACGLVVCMMEGWQDSDGVAYEIAMFEAWGVPIHYLDVEGIL